MALSPLDGVVVAIYLALIMLVGLWPAMWVHIKPFLFPHSSSPSGGTALGEEGLPSREREGIPLEDLSHLEANEHQHRGEVGIEDEEGVGEAGHAQQNPSEAFNQTNSSDNRTAAAADAAANYFLAGRDVSWWAVGLSLFSSNIGSEVRRRRRVANVSFSQHIDPFAHSH